ncbi:MAG: hypothetical protein RR320_02815, partial [Oscillospiraceae bacterium]
MNQQKHWRTLELPRVLEQLAECASCADSRALALAVEPQNELSQARRQMALTVAANTLSNQFG